MNALTRCLACLGCVAGREMAVVRHFDPSRQEANRKDPWSTMQKYEDMFANFRRRRRNLPAKPLLT